MENTWSLSVSVTEWWLSYQDERDQRGLNTRGLEGRESRPLLTGGVTVTTVMRNSLHTSPLQSPHSPHLSTIVSTVSTSSTPLYNSLHSLHILHTDCLLGVSWNVHPSGSAFHETWRAENWTALFHMIFLELYNIRFNILLQINILSSTTFCSELIRKYTNLFIANLLWWSFLQIILNFQVIQCWSNKRYLERL